MSRPSFISFGRSHCCKDRVRVRLGEERYCLSRDEAIEAARDLWKIVKGMKRR